MKGSRERMNSWKRSTRSHPEKGTGTAKSAAIRSTIAVQRTSGKQKASVKGNEKLAGEARQRRPFFYNAFHPADTKLSTPPTPTATTHQPSQSPTAAAIAGPYNAATAARDDGVPLSPATSGADTTPWQV